jgi:sugar transferase (PEP-CTERM system associated)
MYRFRLRSVTLVGCETLLILAAVGAGAYLRLGDWAWIIVAEEHGVAKTFLVAAVTQTCLYYADLYDMRRMADRHELFIRLAQALAAASFLLAALYYWFPGLVIGRGVFAIASVFAITLIISWRLLFEWMSRRVGPRERLLLVGTNAAAVTLAEELFARRQELAVEIVGFIDANPARVGAPLINPGIIGTIEDIPSIVRARAVDRVVVSLADARGMLPMEKLLDMKIGGVSFDHLASVYEEYTGKIAIENLRPSWFIFSPGFRKSRLLGASKRGMDLILAGFGLALAWPLMLVIGALVRLTSTGPALYHQQRVGRHGQIFTVHKFRTMRIDAEEGTGPVWAQQDDKRITSIGRGLRRARLDELPQLWNVLKGDMSLVGPRPERPEFVTDLTRQIPYYGQRHTVRPGVTGWAQVRYTYGASVEDALEKLQYDLFYIKNLSIALDLFIVFETIKTVILRRGA